MELIKNIIADNLVKAKASFSDVMTSKVIDKLDQLKKTVASNLYKDKKEES
ncbi:MAG: hypothetical protein ABGX42_00525 [Gammaproteobacteria bacterium]